MRGMMLAGGATLLGGGAYASGAFDRGEYYAMDPAAVEARLASLHFGEELGRNEADRVKLVLRSSGSAVVRWDLMLEGERVADVRAHLAPEDAGTRVKVEFAFTKGDALMGLEEDPFLNEIAEIAMEEKVDSTLDGRAFNTTLVQAKMAAAVAANPQAVANLQKKAQQTASDRMKDADEADYYSDSSGDTGSGKPAEPTVSTRPSVSTKPPRPTNFNETHADGGWGKK